MAVAQLAITCREAAFPFDDTVLALAAKRFRADLDAQVKAWMSTVSQARPQPLTPVVNVQSLVDTYADHVCFDPVGDIGKFLPLLGVPMTPGGVPTDSVVLAFPRKGLLPNTVSMGAIGEGLAGWYMRYQKGMRAICRPSGTLPDIIFSGQGRYCLVGVKASFRQSVLFGRMAKDAAELLREVSAVTHRMRSRFLVYAVGVHIVSTGQYDLYILELEQV